MRTDRKNCVITFAFDCTLSVAIFLFLSVYFFPDQQSRAWIKASTTANAYAILFLLRMRLCKCKLYPLRSLKQLGCPLIFSRIRMKLADLMLFYYLLFTTLVDSLATLLDATLNRVEVGMLATKLAFNIFYILYWAICTNSRSYRNFPSENS